MIRFTPTVGVAPGTTTMQLGCPHCATPDEPWAYTQPPNVETGYPSGMDAASWAAMTGNQPTQTPAITAGMDPYGTDSTLRDATPTATVTATGSGTVETPMSNWTIALIAGLGVIGALVMWRLAFPARPQT